MEAIVRGAVICPRIFSMESKFLDLAWNLNLRIEMQTKKSFFMENIMYKIEGDIDSVKIFEHTTNQMFNCKPIYLRNKPPNTMLCGSADSSADPLAVKPAQAESAAATVRRELP